MVAEDVSILCAILKLFGSMSPKHFLHEHLLSFLTVVALTELEKSTMNLAKLSYFTNLDFPEKKGISLSLKHHLEEIGRVFGRL